jgi:2,3-bisphosphoglycerate-independent phosphoglycerate mutase
LTTESARPTGRQRPVLLVILDGWGIREQRDANAVALARKPVFERLLRTCPSTQLQASGRAVGLPEGQMGNSEVGHLTIGSGRILLQDRTRIDEAIADGDFFSNPALLQVLERACDSDGAGGTAPPALHLVGLLSDGGVHSHIEHCFSLLELARRRGCQQVFVHAFTDGRDASPTGGAGYVRELQRVMGDLGIGTLATLVGRYWAMDRDRRWERIRVAHEALTLLHGTDAADPVRALEESYRHNVTDEFLKPVILAERGAIREGDGLVFFNFRADRARQLTRALCDPSFREFRRPVPPARVPLDPLQVDASEPQGTAIAGGPQLVVRNMVTMVWYDDDLPVQVAFPLEPVQESFGEVVSRAGLRQLRAAETEKYAHVTYFFSGGLEDPFPGEDRLLVASPKVATYDLQPEMSAPELTTRAIEAVRAGRHDVVILNYANPDMVGHTGDLEAAIRAVEAVDTELGRLLEDLSGTALVIADHGNAETMREPDGSPHTAHTTNPVPCILVGGTAGALRDGGGLQDVAPTLLRLLGLDPPAVMTGRDLCLAEAATQRRGVVAGVSRA